MFLEVKNKVRERFNSFSGLPLFFLSKRIAKLEG
jgi:hypothetical protein